MAWRKHSLRRGKEGLNTDRDNRVQGQSRVQRPGGSRGCTGNKQKPHAPIKCGKGFSVKEEEQFFVPQKGNSFCFKVHGLSVN